MRRIIPIMLTAGLFIPGTSGAIGLGAIKIHSTLNQPLDASIRLLSLRDVALTDIQAVLGSPDQYRRMNLELDESLGMLHFEVTRDKNGKAIIHIYTKEPLTEPYTQVLLDVKWPSGQLLRSYNILLDPPNYSLAPIKATSQLPKFAKSEGAAKPEIEVAEKTPEKPTEKLAKVAFDEQKATAEKAVMATQSSKRVGKVNETKHVKYGPTGGTDNLWDIAQQVERPDGVSINQAIVAILQKNPQAFIKGNMNGLKKGVRLSLPTKTDVTRIKGNFADNQVAKHNKYWKLKKSLPPIRIKHQDASSFAQTQQQPEVTIAEATPVTDNTVQAVEPELTSKNEAFAAKKPVEPMIATDQAGLAQQGFATPQTAQQLAENQQTIQDSPDKKIQEASSSPMDALKTHSQQALTKQEPKASFAQASTASQEVISDSTTLPESDELDQATLDETPKNSMLSEVSRLSSLLKDKELPVPVQEHQNRVSDIEKSPLLNSSNRAQTKLEKTLRAELALSAQNSAIAAEQNAIYQQQIAELKQQNLQLLEDINQRNAQVEDLKLQVTRLANVVEKRTQQLSSQAYQHNKQEEGKVGYKLLIATLIMLVSGSSYAWYRRISQAATPKQDPEFKSYESILQKSGPSSTASKESKQNLVQDDQPRKIVPKKLDKAEFSAKHPEVTFSSFKPKAEDKQRKMSPSEIMRPKDKASDDNTIEFEGGLYASKESVKQQEEIPQDSVDVNDIEDLGDEQSPEHMYRRKLELAKRHIKFHDYHEAYMLLTEIIDEGDNKSSKQAQELLDQIQR